MLCFRANSTVFLEPPLKTEFMENKTVLKFRVAKVAKDTVLGVKE